MFVWNDWYLDQTCVCSDLCVRHPCRCLLGFFSCKNQSRLLVPTLCKWSGMCIVLSREFGHQTKLQQLSKLSIKKRNCNNHDQRSWRAMLHSSTWGDPYLLLAIPGDSICLYIAYRWNTHFTLRKQECNTHQKKTAKSHKTVQSNNSKATLLYEYCLLHKRRSLFGIMNWWRMYRITKF